MASPSQLSFLPDDYLERKAQRRSNAICGVLFLVVMGGISAAFVVSERATKRTDQEFAQVDQTYMAEANRLQQVRQMHDQQKRMARQAELTASLIEGIPRSKILAELTNRLPAGVSLLDVMMDSKAVKAPAAAAAATAVDAVKTAYEQKKAARGPKAEPGAAAAASMAEPRKYDVLIKISGIARTDQQVGDFLGSLNKSALFKDVNLPITDEYNFAGNKKAKSEKLRQFKIEMQLHPNAEARSKEMKQQETAQIEMKSGT